MQKKQEKTRSFIAEYGLFLAGVLLMLVAWELAVRAFSIPRYILPAPTRILARFVTSYGLLAKHTWVTLKEVLAGIALGGAVAFALSLGMVSSRVVRRMFYPLTVLAQTFPKEAFAPIFVVWFGFGLISKVVMAALISFFPLTVNAERGFRSVDPLARDLMKSLSASRWQVFLKLRLPYALPYIFSALKVSVTLAVVGAIIGEFVGASAGLGHLMMIANSEMRVDLLFACLTVLGLLGVLLFFVVERLERLLMPWHESMADVNIR